VQDWGRRCGPFYAQSVWQRAAHGGKLKVSPFHSCVSRPYSQIYYLVITRLLVDELTLPPVVLNQWTDFELSQFVVPVACPKSVLPTHPLFICFILTYISKFSPPRCIKPNLFELFDYNRSKILICTHGCECAWCRDCSRRVNIETPHDCEDAALEELAGERRWMRCPRPSTSWSLISFHSYSWPNNGVSRLQSYGGKKCWMQPYHLPVWNVSQSIKIFVLVEV
jgi:hypothetical protein